MNLPRRRPTPSLLLRSLDLSQRSLLLRQRRIQLLMRIVLLEPRRRQLVRRRRKNSLPKVFAPQLADEGKPCRGEKHLLSDGRRVGDIGYCDEVRGGRMTAEDDIERFFGFDVRCEKVGYVGRERGARGGGEEADGDELFALDCSEEAEVGWGGEEIGELGG